MPSLTTSSVALGTYNPLTDAFTSVLDLNDNSSIFQLTNSPEIGMPELQIQRAGNPRADGDRITNLRYGNRQVNMRMAFGKALRYDQIRALLTTFIKLVSTQNTATNGALVLRYAPPSPAANVNYSYFDIIAVSHDGDKLPAMRILNGTAKINAVLECAPFIRGDRQYLQNLSVNAGFEMPAGGGNATNMVRVFDESFTSVLDFAVQAGSNPTLASNVMTVPNSTRLAFGSPAWAAMHTLRFRFKYATSLSLNIYVHYTDASNFIRLQINNTTMNLNHTIGGVSHTLATTSAYTALVNGTFYWVNITQYPFLSGAGSSAPYIECKLANDSAGAFGSLITNANINVKAFDGVTAMSGRPQIFPTGAACDIGGNFSSVFFVVLFGPSGWIFNGGGGTGKASGAWEGTRTDMGQSGTAVIGTHTVSNTVVSSLASARIDFPPAGSVDTTWNNYIGGTPGGTDAYAIPAGSTMAFSVNYKTSGLNSTSFQRIDWSEYDNTGVLLRSYTTSTHSGNQTSWSTFTGTVVMGANTMFVQMQLRCGDASVGSSANGSVWWDNIQVWDATATNMATMPYCEMRFANSPGQVLLTGLLGEVPSPASLYLATYCATGPTSGQTLPFYFGLRSRAGANAHFLSGTDSLTNVLDSNSWMGAIGSGNVVGAMGSANLDMSIADVFGTYRLLLRAKTTQTTPNLAFTTVQPFAATVLSGSTSVATTFYKLTIPAYSVNTTFQTTDAGLISLPAAPLAGNMDPTQSLVYCSVDMEDPNIGGITVSWNYLAMVPADDNGSLVMGQITTPSGLSNGVIFQLNIDGYNTQLQRNDIDVTTRMYASSSYSIQPMDTRRAIWGVGIAGASGRLGVTLSQDSVPYVDPTVTIGSTTGINQGLALFTDNTSTILPIWCDLAYTPLYLYPRS